MDNGFIQGDMVEIKVFHVEYGKKIIINSCKNTN